MKPSSLVVRRILPLLIVPVLLVSPAGAGMATTVTPVTPAVQAELAGHWEGAIEVPGQALEIDIDFAVVEEGWTGDITIPAQNASDLPLGEISLEGAEVRFTIPGIPGDPTFEGTLEGDTISGDFSQGGATYPFELSRGPDRAAKAQEALEGIDEVIESALDDFGVPGLAVALVADDEVVLSRGYGLRDIEAEQPVDPDTLFAIGSTTKAFTAFLLGTLVDEGKIEWDTPVIEYLPDFRLKDPHATRRLKVRDLLIHSSGLPRHDLAWYSADVSRQELVGRLRHLEPTRDLGEEFQYQNLMFMTAGYLAEQVTGERWEELVRERIFEPLGMERSNFSVETSEEDPNHALPYSLEDGEPEAIPFRNIDAVGPAGSINSSVAEMTAWMRLHLGDGTFEGERLIEESTLKAMHAPQMAISGYPEDQRTLNMGYGMGWMVESHRGRFTIQHGGGIDGFISWVALLPMDDVGVVVYTNATGINPLPTAIGRTIIDRVLGLEDGGYLERARENAKKAEEAQDEAEEKAEVRRVEGTSPSHPLEDYVGTYEHPGYGEIRVSLEDAGGSPGEDGDETEEKRLTALFHDIPTTLEHWHYDTFNGVVEEDADATFEDVKFLFRLDVDGEISELLLPLEPTLDPIAFERQPDERLSDPDYLARFTGTYEMATQRVEVSLKGERLRLTVPGQPTFVLEPVRGTEFVIGELKGYRVEFLLDDEGKVTAARVVQPNGIFEAERIEEP